VILAILFWSSLLTLTGYLLSDLLLIFTDPKIRQSEWKK
jgi:ABC-type dipeptide/oligopeptide/nickel transport system permease component